MEVVVDVVGAEPCPREFQRCSSTARKTHTLPRGLSRWTGMLFTVPFAVESARLRAYQGRLTSIVLARLYQIVPGIAYTYALYVNPHRQHAD